jgi:hypothetical protein
MNKRPEPLTGALTLSRDVHGTLINFEDEKILGTQAYLSNHVPNDPSDVPLKAGRHFEIARAPHKWEAEGTGKDYPEDFYTIRSDGRYYNVGARALEAAARV